MSNQPTTPPNDLRALIAEALHAYELAHAAYLKSMAIGHAEQERSSHLLASIQQVEDAARNLLEKAGLAHIAGAPLSLDGRAALVHRADESVATIFAATHLAAADLRAGLLQLARSFTDAGSWENARCVLQPLLDDTKSSWYAIARDLLGKSYIGLAEFAAKAERWDEVRLLAQDWLKEYGENITLQQFLCEAHYYLGTEAVKAQMWSLAVDHLLAVWKIVPDYKDTRNWLRQYPLPPWRTGQIGCIGILQHQSAVGSVAFSPDGCMLASASGNSLHLWDVASRIEIHSQRIPNIDERVLYIKGISFRDNESIEGLSACRHYYSGGSYENPYWFVYQIASKQFSTTSTSLYEFRKQDVLIENKFAVCKSSGSTLVIQDQNKNKLVVLEHLGGINDIVVSPDNSLLALAGSDGTVRLWGFKV